MDAISRFVLSAWFNLVWQVVVVAAAAGAGAWLLARWPARQHTVWLAAFALCLAAPLTSLMRYRGSEEASGFPWAPQRPAPLTPESDVGRLILVAYVASVLWGLARVARAWWCARRIVVNAQVVECGPVELRCSEAAEAPFTFGVRRPVIVLPARMLEASWDDVRSAVTAHERAHIRRRDVWINLLFELAFPWLLFHPVAHWMRSRLRAAREMACDDAVVGSQMASDRYADVLVRVAMEAAAGSDELELRIRRLMRPQTQRGSLVWRGASSLALLAAAASIAVTCSFLPSDPSDYTGVWRENWAQAFHSELVVDRAECCFRTLEIRYHHGRFDGSVTTDTADVQGNRVLRTGRLTQIIEQPVLQDGVLRFRQPQGRLVQVYEVMPGRSGMLVRNHLVEPSGDHWTFYSRLR